MSDKLIIIIVIAAAIVGIVFLTWKNMKDKKTMNPDAQDSVEEEMMDKERDRDKL
jgi:FtsZ-interacting cell division protein ZipA